MRVCDELRHEGVRYCHWKSTEALDRSASGENDLDLLIHDDDVKRFVEIVIGLGFREALVTRSQHVEGIRHFYGLDEPSGRLVDVHAHERLVIGDDATKNYHVPIEHAYLASTIVAGPFAIPEPEMEFALLVVRMMLKHGTPEALLTGRGRLSAGERRELVHLERRLNPSSLGAGLARAGFLDVALIDRCRRSLDPRTSLRSRMRAWGLLRPRLAPYARRARAADVWLQGSRRVAGRFRRHVLHRPRRKRPASGGAVIAVIGSDGAGKSTAIRGLSQWLAPVFWIANVHLGKPRRSPSWLALRGAARLTRFLRPAGDGTVKRAPGPGPLASPGVIATLTAVATARDRRRASERAHRLAARGAIVLCDRYPMPQLATDGARLGGVPERAEGMIAGRSEMIERRSYERIRRPDVTLALRVDPEVAVARRPADDPSVIRARSREVLEAGWPHEVVQIDAEAPVADVLAALKAEIWKRL